MNELDRIAERIAELHGSHPSIVVRFDCKIVVPPKIFWLATIISHGNSDLFQC